MNPSPPAYRKLPGGGLTWSGRGTLWLADDHLLEVTSFFVAERYRRFFFREIRAFAVQRTNVLAIWAWVLGGIAAIFTPATIGLIFAGLQKGNDEGRVFLYILAGFCAPIAFLAIVLFIVNFALGPSCRCHVLTRTGWQILSGPSRLSAAVLTQLRVIPLIDAGQNNATPPETAPLNPV
jgi:hypothetical protein